MTPVLAQGKPLPRPDINEISEKRFDDRRTLVDPLPKPGPVLSPGGRQPMQLPTPGGQPGARAPGAGGRQNPNEIAERRFDDRHTLVDPLPRSQPLPVPIARLRPPGASPRAQTHDDSNS